MALIPAAFVLISAWPLIVAQVHRGRMASDQLRYHEVVVRVLARAWPEVVYRDYLSATTPGYHTAIAALSTITGDDRATLQILGSLFTLALVACVTLILTRRATPTLALALTAPIACSIYIWPNAVWLLPDAAGWLGVLGMLALALREPTQTGTRGWAKRTLLPACFVLLALVFVRQVHVWTAAALWTSAWLAPRVGEEDARRAHSTRAALRREFASIVGSPLDRLPYVLLAIAATLPAFALLGWFIVQWGGLTPPHFAEAGEGQVAHAGANLAAPAYVLAVFGALSPFYLPFIAPSLRTLVVKHRVGMLIVAGATLFLAVLPATTYSQEGGRWSGVIWSVVRATPAIASHTSPVLAILAVVGGVALLAWAIALPTRDRWILLAALVAFTAAQTANHQAWQRYVEPMALIWLALASVRVPIAASPLLARLRLAAPAALACGFAAMCALIVVRGKPFPVGEYDRRVLPLIDRGDDDAARAALDEIRRMFQDQGN